MLRDESKQVVVRFPFYRFTFLALCSGWFSAPALAQQDTTAHELRTVEVFGKPAEVFAVGSRVSQLDSSYLRSHTSSSLADVLQNRTPLYLKSYGVSGLASVSFRGTSAAHTAVLWNGLNIAQPTLGQSDFATLPVGGLGEVAVQYGAAGATYGSGAIGGAVLLTSPGYTSEKGFGAELQQDAGSFGHYFSSARASFNTGKLQAGAGLYLNKAQNNFPYKDLSRFGTPETREDHAAQQQYGFTQDLVWHLTPQSHVALHSWYTQGDRDLQAAMGAAHNNARQQDRNLRLMAEYGLHSAWGETSIKAGFFDDYLKYSDNSTRSESDVATYQLQAEQTYSYGQRWSLRGGINLQQFRADADGYGQPVQENRAAAFALFRYDPTATLKLSLNLRQAFVQGYAPRPAPTLGASWEFLSHQGHHLYLKGNIAGSYRVPTLNDRFWQPGGRTDLQPEQGWSYEAGLRHVYAKGPLVLESEATYYHMLLDNWIQWSPSEAGYWMPQNLQKVRAQGIELSSRASANAGEVTFSASAGYSYTSSEQVASYEGPQELGHQLAYVPLHKATLAADAAYHTWSFGSSLNYTGLRYRNNSNTASLAAFALLNLWVGKQLKLQNNTLALTARLDNATNAVYQTMENRAMPPRSYTLSVRFLIP
ncbi:TonB-dependent receptor [Pontibacter liquoris]|uniref:TonB-dependent receptor n=1 Tax=Pontibacter liquoris TaxID=2905677 RepID=UPI001FA71C2B|nr:TonB-dependent receptor plug domain-containing protein [Pontibacter liquoris]